MYETFTPGEAAAVAGVPRKRVYKEIEHQIIPRSHSSKLPLAAAVYLYAMHEVNFSFPVPRRKDLYQKTYTALSQNTPKVGLAEFCEISVGEIKEKLIDRLNKYEAWTKKIVQDPNIKGGEPVFPNSRLSVYHIGSMLNRSEGCKEEILEDYPYLTEEDLLFARIYASSHPRDGRPRTNPTAAR